MSGKNKKSKKKNTQKNLGDVTINDFANATVCKNRVKKSVSSTTTVLKQIDDRLWDEKLDDFDCEFDFIEEENEDGTKSMVLQKREGRRRRKTENEIVCDQGGVEYPLDIWFLISEHVKPEDIGRFATICRASWEVTCSAKFWFGLYRRYYRSVPGLPERLQPECMVRLYGLRACVIRALHHFYVPFIIEDGKCNSKSFFYEHPSALVKRVCVTAWHERVSKGIWTYRWKLREMSNITARPATNTYKPDLLEMLDDVHANTEQGCRILQVTCPHFISAPPVMGLRLTSARVGLSQGFAAHRVTLKFDQHVEIVLDPVTNACVLDWWQPRYPHPPFTTPCLTPQE